MRIDALSSSVGGNAAEFVARVNKDDSSRRLFVFGLGNVGRAVADLAKSAPGAFETVVGTVRSNDDRSNANDILFDDETEVKRCLSAATHVLVTVPMVRSLAEEERKGSSSAFIDIVLQKYATSIGSCDNERSDDKDLEWFGYVSTTGVYGDHQGAWVDEMSSCRPRFRSKAEAYERNERSWIATVSENGASSSSSLSVAIFRCAALYGNHASALHTVLKRRRKQRHAMTEADARDERERCTSRVHVEDVARAVVASMLSSASTTSSHGVGTTTVYNVADDEPAPRAEVATFCRRLLDEAPELYSTNFAANARSTSSPSDRSRRRGTDDKKVSNQRMKEDLLRPCYGSLDLLFPNYREGLTAVADHFRSAGTKTG